MKFKIFGVVFVTLLATGVWGTYAIFTKKFADYDEVTLSATNIGQQLPQRGDVKIRGKIVGEVLDVATIGPEEAEVTLGLFPEETDIIPANVTGAILPKTLFGEKFVSLELPDNPAAESIQAGDTIDRTDVSIEVEKVLSDLYPLLRTVQPAELNKFLTALSNALEGRGEQLGENLETLDGYMKKLNPEIPRLLDDLRLTAEVSDIYSDVLPDVAAILRNQITTLGTLEEREDKLNALFTDVGRFSTFTKGFLNRNDTQIIQSARLGAQQLEVFARYAPEFPCLAGGIVKAGKAQAEAFRGYTLHINLELLPNQPRAYEAGDRPRYGADSSPHCGTLPNPPYDQENRFDNQPDFDDGVDEPTGKGTSRAATGFDAGGASAPQGMWPGSTPETKVLKSLLGPTLGVSDAEVPDLGPLLVGPLARGAEVSLR